MRGWSQETLAAKVQCLGGEYYDVTRQVVGNIESGRRNAYHWHIRGIRSALHCTFDEIFLGPKVDEADASAFLKKPRKHNR
jgi:DNA-binding XRE family transcriptional regulator